MSKTIDEKIVSIKLNNKNFEDNARQTIGTLDRLKMKLGFKGSTSSIDDVNKSLKKVSTNHIEKGIDSVIAKFSAMDVAAMSVISNITNRITNLGTHIAKQVTMQPVMDGLKEYETQINSTQTIMSNTGRSVQDVNRVLDELNEYADLTIYDFTTMTKNAGMFTAALGKTRPDALEKSAEAMKGIGNWAAYAGAGTEDMARATYQLGQALTQGSIKLMDWKSIENTGGMAGANFQQAFIDAAIERAGQGSDQATFIQHLIDEKGFRESLKENWLTVDVFFDVMQKFANDPAMTDAATKIKTFTQLIDTVKEALGTGWADTWRIIIGDFEEARDLWTSVSKPILDTIDKISKSRKDLLTGWKAGGGRNDLFEGLKNVVQAASQIFKALKDGFRTIFPPTTSQQLIDMTSKFKNFTATLILSEDKVNNLKSTFSGVFAVIKVGWNIFKDFTSAIARVLGHVVSLGTNIFKLTGPLGDGATKISKWSDGFKLFSTIADKIIPIIDTLSTKIGEFFDKIRQSELLKSTFSNIKNIFTNVGKGLADNLGPSFNTLKDSMSALFKGDFTSFLDILKNKFQEFKSSIKDGLSNFNNFTSSISKSQTPFQAVGKAASFLGEKLVALAGSFKTFLKNTMTFDNFRKTFSMFLDLFTKGATVYFIYQTAQVSKNLNGLLTTVKHTFSALTDVFKFDKLGLQVNAFKELSTGIVMIATSIKLLENIDKEQLQTIATVLITMLIALSLVLDKLSQQRTDTLNGLFSSLKDAAVGIMSSVGEKIQDFIGALSKFAGIAGVATIILALTHALTKLSQIDGWTLLFTASGVAAGLTLLGKGISKFSTMVNNEAFDKMAINLGKIALGLTPIILSLTFSIRLLAKIPFEQALSAVAALGTVLFTLSASLSIISNNKFGGSGNQIEKSAAGLAKVCGSLIPLALALKLLSTIRINDIGDLSGIGEMAAAIAIVTIALKNITKATSGESFNAEKITALGKTIGKFSTALIPLSIAFKILGSMSIEQSMLSAASVFMNFIPIVSAFAGLCASSRLIKNDQLSGQLPELIQTMTRFTLGFIPLAISLKILGSMDLQSQLQALSAIMIDGFIPAIAAIGTAMGAIHIFKDKVGEATAILGQLSPFLISMSGSLVLMAAAVRLLAGINGDQMGQALAGIAAFEALFAAFIAIASKIQNASDVIVGIGDVLTKGLTAVVAAVGIIGSIGGEKIVEELNNFSNAIVNNQENIQNGITTAFTVLFNGIIDAIRNVASNFIDMLKQLITDVFKAIPEALSQLSTPEILIDASIIGGIFIIPNLVNLLGPVCQAAMVKLPWVLGFFAAFGAGIEVIAGLLTALGGLMGNMLNWGPIHDGLMAIASTIGEFIGTLNASKAKAEAAAYPEIGKKINAFVQEIAGISVYSNDIDIAIDTFDKLSNIFNKISGIMATFGYNIGGFKFGVEAGVKADTSTIPNMITQITPLADSIKTFAEKISGLDKMSESIDTAINVLNSIANLFGTIPNIGNVQQKTQQFLTFLSNMNSDKGLTASVKKFGEAIKGIDKSITTEDLETFKSVMNAMTEIINNMPSYGVAQAFAGFKKLDLSEVGTSIKALSTAVKQMGEAIKGIDKSITTEDLETFKFVMNAMTEIINNMPSYGVAQAFAGFKKLDLSEVGTSLKSLGKAVKDFGENIKDITTNKEQITVATEVLKTIPGIFNSLNEFGGKNINIDNWWKKTEAIESVFNLIGNKLTAAFNSFAGSNTTIQAAMPAIKDIFGFEGKPGVLQGIFDAFTSFATFGPGGDQKIVNQEAVINSRIKLLTDTVIPNIKNIVEAFNSVTTQMPEVKNIDSLYSIFGGNGQPGVLKNLVESIATISTIDNMDNQIEDAQKIIDMIPKVLQPIKDNQEVLQNISNIQAPIESIFGDNGVFKTLISSITSFASESKDIDAQSLQDKMNILENILGISENSKGSLISNIINAFSGISGSLQGFDQVSGAIESIFGDNGVFKTLISSLTSFASDTKDFDAQSLQDKMNILENILGTSENGSFISNIVNAFSGVSGSLQGFDQVSGAIESIFGAKEKEGALTKVLKAITNFAKDTSDIDANSLQEKMNILENILGTSENGSFISNIINAFSGVSGSLKGFDQVSGAIESIFGTQEKEGVLQKVINTFGKLPQDFDLENAKNLAAELPNIFGKINEAVGKLTGSAANEGEQTGDFSQLNTVIESLKKFLAVFGEGTESQIANINNFSEAVKNLANTSINEFVQSLQNGTEAAVNAINTFMSSLTTAFTSDSNIVAVQEAIHAIVDSALNELTNKSDAFAQKGTELINKLSEGVNSDKPHANLTIQELLNEMLNTLSQKDGDFISKGINFVQSIVNGINTQAGTVDAAIDNCCQISSETEASIQASFYNVGSNCAQGLINGLQSKESQVNEIAARISQTAADSARKAADIHSPSKVWKEIGINMAQGSINGLEEMIPKMEDASNKFATSAAFSFSNIFDQMQTENYPTIRPKITPIYNIDDFRPMSIDADVRTNLETIFSRPVNNLYDEIDKLSTAMENNNNQLKEEVMQFKNDWFDLYNSAESEVGLYMDSKKVASTIAKPMNKELNILMKRGG